MGILAKNFFLFVFKRLFYLIDFRVDFQRYISMYTQRKSEKNASRITEFLTHFSSWRMAKSIHHMGCCLFEAIWIICSTPKISIWQMVIFTCKRDKRSFKMKKPLNLHVLTALRNETMARSHLWNDFFMFWQLYVKRVRIFLLLIRANIVYFNVSAACWHLNFTVSLFWNLETPTSIVTWAKEQWIYLCSLLTKETVLQEFKKPPRKLSNNDSLMI